MPGPHLTTDELAAELGRTPRWLMDNWRDLIKTQQLPAPLLPAQPYVWSRAHIYAWLDRGLSAKDRQHAAAYRAAVIAAGESRISGVDMVYEAERAAALVAKFSAPARPVVSSRATARDGDAS